MEQDNRDTDLDIYTRMTQNELVRELKKLGYSESKDINFTGNKYFFDENGLYSYFVFRNKKIEVKFIQDEKIENIANLSDINFNCCAYCINNKKIVYDKEIDLIQNKILYFSNPKLAEKDPIKILSALKQIARLPDIQVPQETEETIKNGIGRVIEYFYNNPDKLYKLKDFLCEVNGSEVISYFPDNQKVILKSLETKKDKINISLDYVSKNINDLNEEEYKKILSFVMIKYGKRFDPSRANSKKINSVVYKKTNEGEITACCLFNGLRLYSIASNNINDIVEMVKT
ncbi:MAG: hypothetical protein EOM85_02350 [Candidatus Moranbacteria bacterium]|nr:hypothetical protein [Candidatus Moranbacteria bacterium]